MVCLSGFNATYTRPYVLYEYTATALMSSHVTSYVLYAYLILRKCASV